MTASFEPARRLLPSASLATLALAMAARTVLDGSNGLFAFVLATALGAAGLTRYVDGHDRDALYRATRRWWLLAGAAFVPYGLSVAPASDSAAAVGAALSGPAIGVLVEVAAGATALAAVVVSVSAAAERLGVRPDGTTPEERVLGDVGD